MSQATLTKPVRAGIRGAGRYKLRTALEQRQTMTTSGSLWAEQVTGRLFAPERGRLNETEWAALKAAHSRGLLYVVYSYTTPIAWVETSGTVYRVAQRFSVTTSRHQSALTDL